MTTQPVRIVTPLAGPDFVSADGRLKALIETEDGPLLRSVLTSRAWRGAAPADAHSFILFDRPETRRFVETHLADWFPEARVSFLSAYTQGAAFSALVGVAGLDDADTPIVVDLADVAFRSDFADPSEPFRTRPDVGGVALTFESDHPAYSYLRRDDAGAVVEAAEKRVISNEASAGVYVFRNAAVYLRALAHAIDHAETQTHKGLFFVCPLFNGVLAQGLAVETIPVHDVRDVKTS